MSGTVVNVLLVLGSIGRCIPVLISVVATRFVSCVTHGVYISQRDVIVTFYTVHSPAASVST